ERGAPEKKAAKAAARGRNIVRTFPGKKRAVGAPDDGDPQGAAHVGQSVPAYLRVRPEPQGGGGTAGYQPVHREAPAGALAQDHPGAAGTGAAVLLTRGCQRDGA